MSEPTLKDRIKKVEKQLAMGKPPEYDRAVIELLLEACDEIRVLKQRVDECDRRDRLAAFSGGCKCKHG